MDNDNYSLYDALENNLEIKYVYGYLNQPMTQNIL